MSRPDIETNFSNLIEMAKQLDPLKLLSQLTLTFLFVPEDQCTEESSDTFKWARRIEFLAGHLLTQEYPKNAKNNVEFRQNLLFLCKRGIISTPIARGGGKYIFTT